MSLRTLISTDIFFQRCLTHVCCLSAPCGITHLRLSLLDARALARLQSDHINRTLVPAFYRYLQAQSPSDQITHGKAFLAAIEKLIELFEKHGDAVQPGLWAGEELGWADVMVVPCGCPGPLFEAKT